MGKIRSLVAEKPPERGDTPGSEGGMLPPQACPKRPGSEAQGKQCLKSGEPEGERFCWSLCVKGREPGTRGQAASEPECGGG